MVGFSRQNLQSIFQYITYLYILESIVGILYKYYKIIYFGKYFLIIY